MARTRYNMVVVTLTAARLASPDSAMESALSKWSFKIVG